MIKKYNNESTKYKGLYFKPYEVLKAYIVAIIIAFSNALIVYLPLLNLLYLTHYFKLIVGLMLAVTLIAIYVMFFIKDKVLEVYNPEAKNVNLFYIRMCDILIVSVFVIIIFVALILIFRWW